MRLSLWDSIGRFNLLLELFIIDGVIFIDQYCHMKVYFLDCLNIPHIVLVSFFNIWLTRSFPKPYGFLMFLMRKGALGANGLIGHF